jgi:hypothetical protein
MVAERRWGDGKAAMFTAAAALREVFAQMTDRRGWLRLTGAEPTSEQAAADARSRRSEATVATLAVGTDQVVSLLERCEPLDGRSVAEGAVWSA